MVNKKSAINLEISLAEIILSVFIFAIAGVITLNCFMMARYTEVRASDKTEASMKVQSAFEYMKSTENSKEMQELLKRTFEISSFDEYEGMSTYHIYYDENWQECSEKQQKFIIEIKIKSNIKATGEMDDINISVKRKESYPFIKNGNEDIFSISTKKFFPIFITGSI